MTKSKETNVEALRDAIVTFDVDRIGSIAQQALKEGVSAYEAVMNGMAKGMETVGKRYQEGEVFLAELILAGETFKEGMKVLGSHLKNSDAWYRGSVVIGTVEGDLHDIGKHIVASLLQASGFEVYDLGVDVPFDRFLEKAKEVSADIVAMSAMLSTTFPNMRAVIEEIAKAQVHTWTLVGGAPLNADSVKSLGPDGYGKDAVEGVNICKQWVSKREQVH
jgi:methanogenic corrinoid protein MtbC1